MISFLLVALSFIFQPQGDKTRYFEYNNNKVLTTYDVDDRFLGTYRGAKGGYLTLTDDGNGVYKYDVFGFPMEGCRDEPIQMIWGFMVDQDGVQVKFEREYGYSYPIFMKAVDKNASFQGCRKEIMIDFIIESEGTLNVSSSDDWAK